MVPGTLRAMASLILAALAAAQAGPMRVHSWYWKARPDPVAVSRAAEDIRKIHEAANAPVEEIPKAMRDATLAWIAIGFTPLDREHGLPFLFPGLEIANEAHTAEPAFDALVTASLIALRDHFDFKVLEVQSGVPWAEWAAGAALYQKALGRPAADPGLSRGKALWKAIKYGALAFGGLLVLLWLRRRAAAVERGI